jgi:hypothetical protein
MAFSLCHKLQKRFAANGSKETHTDAVWTVADASQEASNSRNKKGKENL